MAIGKNIKIDKLIPNVEEEIIVENTSQKEVTNKTEPKVLDEKPIVQSKSKKEVIEQGNQEGITFIVEPSRRKKVNKATVYIEGRLCIYNANILANKIKELISAYNIIDFKLRNIEDFDLSAIQIFYYFKEQYNNDLKNLSFQIEELPTNLKTILVKTKYNKILFEKPVNLTK